MVSLATEDAALEDTVLIEETESDIEDRETDKPYTKFQYDFMLYPADLSLEVLYDRWTSDKLRVPESERKYVWSKSKASRLIESFLLELPVPGIFLYEEGLSGYQLVIDGQQRLLSVFYYLSGKFADGGDFRLTPNIQWPWGGRAFADLEDEDKDILESSYLRATIIRQFSRKDHTTMFHVFERLNAGNERMSAQEIRNTIYAGAFNDALRRLNDTDKAWRAIMGSPQPSSRLRDVELALRMIALCDREGEYQKPMKDFLNSMMNDHRNAAPEYLSKWESVFKRTNEKIVRRLGEKPFHIRSGLNAAVFDSVAVAFARNLDDIPDDIRQRYARLKLDPDFLSATDSRATDADNVHARIAAAERVLFGN